MANISLYKILYFLTVRVNFSKKEGNATVCCWKTSALLRDSSVVKNCCASIKVLRWLNIVDFNKCCCMVVKSCFNERFHGFTSAVGDKSAVILHPIKESSKAVDISWSGVIHNRISHLKQW